jgi:hypothetical protein
MQPTGVRIAFLVLLALSMHSPFAGPRQPTRYHRVQITASYPIVTQCNCPFSDTGCFVKERIDSLNRTTELEFICDGKAYDGFEAGVVPRIRFEYARRTIIEKNLNSDGTPYYGLEYETPDVITYFLDSDGFIDSCRCEAFVRKGIYRDLDSATVRRALGEARKKGHCQEIWDYMYATAKFSGRYPKSRDWSVDRSPPSPVRIAKDR